MLPCFWLYHTLNDAFRNECEGRKKGNLCKCIVDLLHLHMVKCYDETVAENMGPG